GSGGGLAGSPAAVVFLPLALVGPGARERVANHVLDAHPRARIARRITGWRPRAAAAAPWGPAKRELDARHRALEREILGPRLAPSQLDDVVLAADRIRAAVQDVGGGDAASEIAVDVDVARIEHIVDAGHRAHRGSALVDRVGG